jgi:predicted dehydrogenase
MVESFAAAVLSGAPVPYAPDDAVRNMRAIDALARAATRTCDEDIAPMR